MKTLLVIGATGVMGARVLRLAAQALPDLELRAASRRGGRPGAPGVPRRLDVRNAAQLRQALVGTDLLIDAAGPYDHDPEPVVAACVEAGTHYADLAEDPVRHVRVERAALGAGARDAGVLLVPGASTVPGLLAVLAQAFAPHARELSRIDVWLSLGSRNPVGAGLLGGLLAALGRPLARGGRAMAWTVRHRAGDGRARRFGPWPSALDERGVPLAGRRVPLRLHVGFDRALLTRALRAAAPLAAHASRAAVARAARLAVPAARAAGRLGTPRGSLRLEALDAAGAPLAALDVVAERAGLDVPAWPAVWLAERLASHAELPARGFGRGAAGCVGLEAVVPLDYAVRRLREAGFQVEGPA